MVMVIGLTTMSVLVWALASSMARESDAEKRRVTARSGRGFPATGAVDGANKKQAA
jgi:hypothetical protein